MGNKRRCGLAEEFREGEGCRPDPDHWPLRPLRVPKLLRRMCRSRESGTPVPVLLDRGTVAPCALWIRYECHFQRLGHLEHNVSWRRVQRSALWTDTSLDELPNEDQEARPVHMVNGV